MKKPTSLSVLQSIDKKLGLILIKLDEPKIKQTIKTPKQDLFVLHMKKEYTAQYLFDECKKLFPCYLNSWVDLGQIISDRKGDYTISFKKNIEADEEWKKMSANELKDRRLKFITLEERMLMELEYFKETGQHLDIKNETLCAGSRARDGRVLRVDWHGVQFQVYTYYPGHASDNVCARVAVS